MEGNGDNFFHTESEDAGRTNSPQMIEGFVERLYECCDTENLAEVSRQTGVPYNTLKNYTGENARMPSAEVLLLIARNCGVNLHWLMTGEGSCDPPQDDGGTAADPVKGKIGAAAYYIDLPAITIKLRTE